MLSSGLPISIARVIRSKINLHRHSHETGKFREIVKLSGSRDITET